MLEKSFAIFEKTFRDILKKIGFFDIINPI